MVLSVPEKNEIKQCFDSGTLEERLTEKFSIFMS